MTYSSVENNRETLLKVIDLLYNSVISEGGDGDAIWYSRFYDINDIYKLIKEYNDKLKFPWELSTKNEEIFWGENQEWIVITNNITDFVKLHHGTLQILL